MTKRMAIAALAVVGALIAAYLTLHKLGLIGELACAVGSCDLVNATRWSVFPPGPTSGGGFRVPVAAMGLGFYLVVLAIAIAGVQDRWADSRAISRALVGLSAWGVLFSGYLTYQELFVIHAICQYCVISACIVAVIFALSLLDLRDVTRDAVPA